MIRYLIALAPAAAGVAAQARGFAMKNERGVSWICAGVGPDEREALEGLEQQADLKLLLVTSTRAEARRSRSAVAASGPRG
jgi:hypothetical protein